MYVASCQVPIVIINGRCLRAALVLRSSLRLYRYIYIYIATREMVCVCVCSPLYHPPTPPTLHGWIVSRQLHRRPNRHDFDRITHSDDTLFCLRLIICTHRYNLGYILLLSYYPRNLICSNRRLGVHCI